MYTFKYLQRYSGKSVYFQLAASIRLTRARNILSISSSAPADFGQTPARRRWTTFVSDPHALICSWVIGCFGIVRWSICGIGFFRSASKENSIDIIDQLSGCSENAKWLLSFFSMVECGYLLKVRFVLLNWCTPFEKIDIVSALGHVVYVVPFGWRRRRGKIVGHRHRMLCEACPGY